VTSDDVAKLFAATKLLFAVFDPKGVLLAVVEAANEGEAKRRADHVAPLLGFRYFRELDIAQIDATPPGVATFYDVFFAKDELELPASGSLH